MRERRRARSNLTLSAGNATLFRIVAVLAILMVIDGLLWRWAHNPPHLPWWLIALKYAVIDAPVTLLLYGVITIATTSLEETEPSDGR